MGGGDSLKSFINTKQAWVTTLDNKFLTCNTKVVKSLHDCSIITAGQFAILHMLGMLVSNLALNTLYELCTIKTNYQGGMFLYLNNVLYVGNDLWSVKQAQYTLYDNSTSKIKFSKVTSGDCFNIYFPYILKSY